MAEPGRPCYPLWIEGGMKGRQLLPLTGWCPASRKALWWRKRMTAVIPLLLASADPSPENLSIFDPVSPPAESIRNLSILVLTITAFIFLVVEGILVYSIIRFRRRAANGTMEPPQVYGSKPI